MILQKLLLQRTPINVVIFILNELTCSLFVNVVNVQMSKEDNIVLSAWYHNPAWFDNICLIVSTEIGCLSCFSNHKNQLFPLTSHYLDILNLWIGKRILQRFLFVNRSFFIFSWRRPTHSLWNLYDKDREEKRMG